MTYLVCKGCKRRSKNPSATGYGPVCARKRTPPAPRRHRTPARRSSARPAPVRPALDELPGQEAFDLFFHQTTLWSL
ncbi:hypothetical protein [Streptomyces sp. NPDC058295]|uniref:hypothetical protein n=1 Tax=Streptomyces sp. NPDC058295 TaxID=3346431 RepID=UPI0036EA0683